MKFCLRKYFTTSILFTAVFTILSQTISKGQGCSDAGFCTISSFKAAADSTDKEYKNSFSLSVSYGIGDFNISVTNPYIEYARLIGQKFSVSARLYYLTASGNLASGFSDVILSSTYSIRPDAKATLAVKVPLNDGNLMYMDRTLPMNYQNSLGTFDLIIGLTKSFNNLKFTAGLQQPLTQNNNQYLREEFQYVGQPAFLSTKDFKRSGDIMLRTTYTLSLAKNKFKIVPGILPIYHLANDRYTNESGQEMEIKGSQGLTLNGILAFQYSPNGRHHVEWSSGTPFIARDARPDGLTRKFVTALEYKFRF